MSRVVVDLARLGSFVERLERFQTRLARTCADADARVAALHGTWLGSAADAQAVAHAEWRTGADEVCAALAALRSVATRAQENYTAALAANRRMWTL